MNKILVKVSYPIINQEYEMFIPINKSIGKVTNLVQKAIIELNIEAIPIRNNAILVKSTGEVLEPQKLVYDSNVLQGDKLIIL